MKLHFYLLGRLRIVWGNEPLSLPPFRTHGLLAALLLRPELEHRYQLLGLLFPDLPESSGRRRLSDLLYLLRRALPALPIQADNEYVRLPATARWLDVEAFRQAAQQDDLNSWLAALSLYRGDLLAGYGDDWILEANESLRLQYLQVAHRACQQLVQRQDFEQALPLAERLVQEEPFDEQILRTLMRVYQVLGRRGAALAVYERFTAQVADELGIEPEPDTQALAQAIRDAAPAAPAKPPPLSAHMAPEEVLRIAEESLAHGDYATVEAGLARLRAHPPAGRAAALNLLEADLALAREEYERAGRALASCLHNEAPTLLRVAELAYEQHRWADACDAASEALLLADERSDQASAARALATLALARGERGEISQAIRSAEQSLNLARAGCSPADLTRALAAMGRLLALRGQLSQAQSCLHEALALAREHSFPSLQAKVLRLLARLQMDNGHLLASLETYRRILDVWRDLGNRRREVWVLQGIAHIQAQLGRIPESLRQLELAGEILRQLDDPLQEAVNQYHVGLTMSYDDRLAARAVPLLHGVRAVFHASDQLGWEASTLNALGYALWVIGDYAEALTVLERAYAIHESMRELNVLPEILAYQGLAYLGLDQSAQALACTQRAVLGAAQGGLSEDIVLDVYYAHAMALAAGGNEEQAGLYFRRAYEKGLALAAQLRDEAARRAFFGRNTIMRRLMRESYRRAIAPAPVEGVVQVQLPAAKEHPPVHIRWTRDAGPSDLALKQAQGAIALRRARLARLISEARSQGVTLSGAALAAALGVSLRTVRRDLAWLRGQVLSGKY